MPKLGEEPLFCILFWNDQIPALKTGEKKVHECWITACGESLGVLLVDVDAVACLTSSILDRDNLPIGLAGRLWPQIFNRSSVGSLQNRWKVFPGSRGEIVLCIRSLQVLEIEEALGWTDEAPERHCLQWINIFEGAFVTLNFVIIFSEASLRGYDCFMPRLSPANSRSNCQQFLRQCSATI
jgi:hypothetical protein